MVVWPRWRCRSSSSRVIVAASASTKRSSSVSWAAGLVAISSISFWLKTSAPKISIAVERDGDRRAGLVDDLDRLGRAALGGVAHPGLGPQRDRDAAAAEVGLDQALDGAGALGADLGVGHEAEPEAQELERGGLAGAAAADQAVQAVRETRAWPP